MKSTTNGGPSEAEKLHLACIHEASHAVIAQAVTGAPAIITIEKCLRDGASWFNGRCAHATSSDGHSNRMIALSGACAEAMADGHRYDSGDVLLRAITQRISQADANGAGQFDREDLDACLRLVMANWTQIEARAKDEEAVFANAIPRDGSPRAASTRASSTPRSASGGSLRHFPAWRQSADRQISHAALRAAFGAAVDDLSTVRLAFDDLHPRTWASSAAEALGVSIEAVISKVAPIEESAGIASTQTLAQQDALLMIGALA